MRVSSDAELLRPLRCGARAGVVVDLGTVRVELMTGFWSKSGMADMSLKWHDVQCTGINIE